LLKKAIAFILPSLYEGFGIPVIEAMQAGCPVIVSPQFFPCRKLVEKPLFTLKIRKKQIPFKNLCKKW